MCYDICMNMLGAERIKLIKMQMKSVNARCWRVKRTEPNGPEKYGEYAFLG